MKDNYERKQYNVGNRNEMRYNNLDNKMSSYTCQCSKVCAKLYEHPNFEGDELPIPESIVPKVKDFYAGWNDRVSSVKVTSGCRFVAYDNHEFEKQLHDTTEDIAKLDPDNKITSFHCTCLA